MRKLNILAYLRHYPPPLDGGAYNYNYHLIKQLYDSGNQITVVTHKDVVPVAIQSLTVYPLQSIKTGRHHYATKFQQGMDIVVSVLALMRILSRSKFDWVIVDAGYIQNLIVFLGAFLNFHRVIGINLSEEISSIQKTTKIRAALQRWLLKKHTFNIVISRSTEVMLREIGVKSPILLVYPCIEAHPVLDKVLERKKLVEKYTVDASSLIIGFLGRHIQRKGIHNLILAVSDLRKGGQKISLLVAGSGQESENIEILIRERGCQSFCKMIGPVPADEKASFLCGIDVFATPNFKDPQTGDSEGFGIVFLEAAQQGTSVIGGKDGGAPEAICDGYNGLIVDGHSIASIRNAIEKYYRDASLRLAHGENGKLWAQRFNWQDQVKPLINFLETQ